MSAVSVQRLPDELLEEVQAGRVAELTSGGDVMGVLIPFPADPDERVVLAAGLLRSGVLTTGQAARLARCASILAFMAEVARLRLPDVWSDEERLTLDTEELRAWKADRAS